MYKYNVLNIYFLCGIREEKCVRIIANYSCIQRFNLVWNFVTVL